MARAHLCPDMPVPKLCKAVAVSLGLLAGSLLFSAAQAQTAQAPADAAPGFVSCVRSSNCVDSRSAGGLEPLRYTGTASQGRELLLQTLASHIEAIVEPGEGNLVRAVFTTTLGFKDDVEFWIDPRGGSIDFRSRSRVGLYDLGKNRSRMTEFSARFKQPPGKGKDASTSTP
jgi:uncharacterized protein (DUF1499 family)